MASESVTVFEVGPRDGLQNEPRDVTFDDKLFLIRGLVSAGVRELELGAFVRPDRVPKMSDTETLFSKMNSKELDLGKARAWSLVPNRKGLARAIQAGAKQIAIFAAATDTFSEKNIGMPVADALKEYREVVREAKAAKLKVRGYVSTVFGCPYEGKVAPKKALRVIEKLADFGVFQVSIGDTIGVATPRGVDAVMKPAMKSLGRAAVAAHFHDTRGTALANALRAFELGVRTIDSSAGGLGGCPFAPGATGNLATEDLLYMLDGMGVRTGIDLQELCQVSLAFAKRINRPLSSRYLQAFASQCG
jgi:hydroxymethylglutaryl-CoA lyase